MPFDSLTFDLSSSAHCFLFMLISIVSGTTVAPPTPSGDFGIELEQLASMTRESNFSALEQYGGVSK